MSEQDKYDKDAAELLPCNKSCLPQNAGEFWHGTGCPYVYRPAVAVALRAQGLEIERLTHEWQQAKSAVEHLSQGKPLGELVGKQTIVNMAAELAQLKAQLGEAEKRGMERAVTIANRYGSSYIAEHIRAATAQPGPDGDSGERGKE